MISIKINTVERKIWNKRRSIKLLKYRTNRIVKIKNLKKNGNYFSRTDNNYSVFPPRKNWDEREKFVVPRNFSIEDNRNETLKFFGDIFDYVEKKQGKREIFIDSTFVDKVTESTLMYFFAIISDVKCANYDIGGNHSRNFWVKKIYKNCGFDKLLKNKEFSFSVFNEGNILLIRGNKVKTDVAKNVCKFLAEKVGINTRAFYGAFVELMTNTVQHAYLSEDKLEKKWQVFLEYRDNMVKFIFLDTGKGIPATVKRTKCEKLKMLIPRVMNESDILKSAFEGEFRTRTEKDHRGKGLPQIYNVMCSDYVTNAVVYSGKGYVGIMEAENDVYYSFDDDFYGTLYEFTIRGV